MKRMPKIRLFVAMLVSIGLVLSPVAASNALAAAVSMHANGAAATSSSDKPCPCCDFAKCVAAICTMSCVQLGPSDLSFDIELIGHAVLGGTVPDIQHGLNSRPPTPPPRA